MNNQTNWNPKSIGKKKDSPALSLLFPLLNQCVLILFLCWQCDRKRKSYTGYLVEEIEVSMTSQLFHPKEIKVNRKRPLWKWNTCNLDYLNEYRDLLSSERKVIWFRHSWPMTCCNCKWHKTHLVRLMMQEEWSFWQNKYFPMR